MGSRWRSGRCPGLSLYSGRGTRRLTLLDTGTPVDDNDYQVPFAFTGKLGKITIDLGEASVSPEAIKLMMEELARKRDR